MPGFGSPGVELGKVSYFGEERTIASARLAGESGLLEGQMNRAEGVEL
jgi:hypothetical protein